jgi:hypothetical protein
MVIRQALTSIHNLDDDSLLNIFYISRPGVLEESEYGNILLGDLVGERWWYKCVQVCQRWRYLILGSASYLRLSLLCTRGTPVADMLIHPPPLPLIIHYSDINQDLTAEDEEGIMLALQNRNRVRLINLRISVPSLQRLVTAIDGEFPTLELLSIEPSARQNTRFSLPPTFGAPQLRHLWLDYFTSPIGSPFLTTAVGLVTLFLRSTHTSTYVRPDLFLRAISLLPHLEQLEIGFLFVVPDSEIEGQLSHMPITTPVTLPSLRHFGFWGNSGYLETLLPHMATPFLRILGIHFFNQPSFSVPRLLQFIITAQYRCSLSQLLFHHEGVYILLTKPLAGTGPDQSTYFWVNISCRHLDWQVSSITQILHDLRPFLSSVGELSLDYREHVLSSEVHNEVDPTLWREFLGLFRSVQTLRVHKGLVGDVSRSLRLDGDPSLELLPELKELVCPTGSVEDKSFSPFIHAREVAVQPVKLIGETFPVGQVGYKFYTSTGVIDIAPDPDPLT